MLFLRLSSFSRSATLHPILNNGTVANYELFVAKCLSAAVPDVEVGDEPDHTRSGSQGRDVAEGGFRTLRHKLWERAVK